MNINYNLNIPDAPNNPSNDQPLMRTNTNSIATWVSQDHIGFQANQGGWHLQCHLKETLPNGTVPVTPATFETLYSTVTGVVPQGELFFTRGASGIGIQLTGPGSPNNIANGVSFLPGGLRIQWGFKTRLPAVPVVFPVAFTTTCYSVTVAPQTAAAPATAPRLCVFNINNANFSYTIENTATGFSWIAIGD